MLAGRIVDVELGAADHLLRVVELVRLRRVADVARVNEERRLVRHRHNLVDRGVEGSARIGVGGLAKPMWLSEIWTKEKPPSAAFAAPISRDEGTPPATVHTTPVPAHSMHFKACRRSSSPS